MWAWYKNVLLKHPFVTKATTSCLIMSISDIGCQKIERCVGYQPQQQLDGLLSSDPLIPSSPSSDNDNSNNNMNAELKTRKNQQQVMSKQQQDQQVLAWDKVRTVHVGITGFTLIGPISHLWYKWLEMAVIAFNTESVYVGILIRMVLDAMLFSPIAIGGYFTWRSILEGRNHNGVLENLEHKWFTSLQASWSFWPVANIMYVICPTNIFLREALLLLFAPSLFGC